MTYTYGYTTYDAEDPIASKIIVDITNRFLASGEDLRKSTIKFTTDGGKDKFINHLITVFNEHKLKFQILEVVSDTTYFLIKTLDGNVESFIKIYTRTMDTVVSIIVTTTGPASDWISEDVQSYIDNNKVPILSWYYKTERGVDQMMVPLIDDSTIIDECYPYIGKPVDEYMKDYLDSNESILLLIGEPGTGKTTFIRHMLLKYRMDSIITYDENIISSDSFLSDFLSNKDKEQILIIEDADVMIKNRESNDNKMMNKLLNISDGIIKSTKKKIVFSTNLNSINDVDPALIRPGRCFGHINFRPLTRKEALVAADKLNIELNSDQYHYTLAEIFNEKMNPKQSRKIGFM